MVTFRRAFAAPLLALFLGAVGCEGPSPAPPPVIGAVVSGSFTDGFRFAAEERLRAGTPTVDTIIIAEGSSRTGPALEIAAGLVETPGLIGVVGHSNSAASLATAYLYREAEVVQIAPTSTSPLFSDAGPYSFRLVPPDTVQGAYLASILGTILPAGGRLAVFYVNDEYGRWLRRAFVRNLDRNRYPLAVEFPHVETDIAAMDLEEHLELLAAAGPDLIVWLGRVNPLDPILRGLREGGDSTPILGGDALAPAREFSHRPSWWEGVWFSDFFDPLGTPELRAFTERYRARFHRDPSTGEILSYEAADLLFEALAQGARTGSEVRSWLESLGDGHPPHPGVTGPIAFGATGEVRRTFVLRRVEYLP